LELRQVPPLIVWTITLYLLTVFLYPPDLSEAEEHLRRFQRNRAGYYSAFVAMCVLDIAQTAIHGDLFHPIWYLPFVGQYAVLAAIGLIAHRRGLRSFLCVVPTDHAVNLGPGGKEISRSRHDSRVECPVASALYCHPFVPRTRIGDSLHDAHIAQPIFEIWMGTHAPL